MVPLASYWHTASLAKAGIFMVDMLVVVRTKKLMCFNANVPLGMGVREHRANVLYYIIPLAFYGGNTIQAPGNL